MVKAAIADHDSHPIFGALTPIFGGLPLKFGALPQIFGSEYWRISIKVDYPQNGLEFQGFSFRLLKLSIFLNFPAI